jgi:hypothetical protein
MSNFSNLAWRPALGASSPGIDNDSGGGATILINGFCSQNSLTVVKDELNEISI